MRLLSRVRTFLRNRFTTLESRTLLIGVSGGPDSMALLDVLSRLRDDFGYTLHPLHVNYRFHDRSDAAYRVVKDYCHDRELALTAVSVPNPDEHRAARDGLEARARDLRFEFFDAVSELFESDGLFLAHHRNDQVETVLLNLGRGSGPGGLAGMCPELKRSEMTVYRPFLTLWERNVEEYVEKRDLSVFRDPTNEDEDFARNKLRHTVIPEWKSAQPAPEPAIANHADRVRRENDFWDEFLRDAIEDWVWRDELQVRRASFRKQHPAVQFRYLSQRVASVAGSISGWNETNLQDVRQLFAEGRSGARVSLPNGFRALNEYDRGTLFCSDLERTDRLEGPFEPPESRDWLGVGTIRINASGDEPGAYPSTALRADQLSNLAVRPWNQGDRVPGEETKKIKEIFEENSVPYRARRYWPLLVVNETILAIPGLIEPSGEETANVRLIFYPEHPAFHQFDETYAK